MNILRFRILVLAVALVAETGLGEMTVANSRSKSVTKATLTNTLAGVYVESESDPVAMMQGFVSGTPWADQGYVMGSPWQSEGYLTSESDPVAMAQGFVTGAPWVEAGYLTSTNGVNQMLFELKTTHINHTNLWAYVSTNSGTATPGFLTYFGGDWPENTTALSTNGGWAEIDDISARRGYCPSRSSTRWYWNASSGAVVFVEGDYNGGRNCGSTIHVDNGTLAELWVKNKNAFGLPNPVMGSPPGWGSHLPDLDLSKTNVSGGIYVKTGDGTRHGPWQYCVSPFRDYNLEINPTPWVSNAVARLVVTNYSSTPFNPTYGIPVLSVLLSSAGEFSSFDWQSGETSGNTSGITNGIINIYSQGSIEIPASALFIGTASLVQSLTGHSMSELNNDCAFLTDASLSSASVGYANSAGSAYSASWADSSGSASYAYGASWADSAGSANYASDGPWTSAGFLTSESDPVAMSQGFVTGAPWEEYGYVTGTPWADQGYIASGDVPTYETDSTAMSQGFLTSVPWDASVGYASEAGYANSANSAYNAEECGSWGGWSHVAIQGNGGQPTVGDMIFMSDAGLTMLSQYHISIPNPAVFLGSEWHDGVGNMPKWFLQSEMQAGYATVSGSTSNVVSGVGQTFSLTNAFAGLTQVVVYVDGVVTNHFKL